MSVFNILKIQTNLMVKVNFIIPVYRCNNLIISKAIVMILNFLDIFRHKRR